MSQGIKESAESRFWQHVEKTDTCWLWTASLRGKGYGQFWDGKTQVQAHLFAYRMLRGGIPQGLTIDHLCKVKRCVNPDHLEPVTMHVNILRGDNLAAQNARKTHCIHGHIFSGDNLRMEKSRYKRVCRTCARLRMRRYRGE